MSVTKAIALPTNAIGSAAYDGDFTTYYLKTTSAASYINLDSTLEGRTIRVKLYATLSQETSKDVYFRFLDILRKCYINTYNIIECS